MDNQQLKIHNVESEPQLRTIHKIINPSDGVMGNMRLKNIIHGDFQNYVSPFFLLDEFGPMTLPSGAPFRVDAHPHAGIIPTTYLLKGNAHHKDSMGNDFEYNAGDFIQFTAGSGALHMEETGNELFEHGGEFHGFQGWLNLPPQLKLSSPHASHLQEKNIDILKFENVKIKVILGDLFGTQAKTKLLMPVIYWHVSMKENATIKLPIDNEKNVFLYLQDGKLIINNFQTIHSSQLVLFERDGDLLQIEAKTDSEFLVLGGEVNNEPYVASGPFVLNNDQEIKQAYHDFQEGKFGDLTKTNGTKRSRNYK